MVMSPVLASEPAAEDDLVSGIGSEIKVALDRWSAGHIGISDLLIAGGLIVAAIVVAVILRRLTNRWTAHLEGPAATAGVVIGQISTVLIYLIAMALVLEVLGFGLGPIVIIVLILALAAMVLRPTIHHLSSGLVLQLRAPFSPGDVIETDGNVGVVQEVNTRAVVLITNDGKTLHIPSSDVLDRAMINYSSAGRRRSTLTLRLDRTTTLTDLAETLRANLADGIYVLDEPPLEVVLSGFEGTQLIVDVQFWHRPELWAERVARDRVGRAIVEVLASRRGLLSDPIVVVRSDSSGSITGRAVDT